MNRACLFLLAALLGACERRIVYTEPSKDAPEDMFFVRLAPVTAAPGAPVALAQTPAYERPCGATSDGRVVFTRYGAPTAGSDVLVVNADGTGERRLADSVHNEFCAKVAEGDTVIYSLQPAGRLPDLMAVSANGGAALPLAATDKAEAFLAAAPDKRVLFIRQDQLQRDSLYSVAKPQDAPVLLSPALPGQPDPRFHAVTEGNRVIFSIGKDLFALGTDGTGPAALTAAPALAAGINPSNEFCATAEDGRVAFTHRSIGVVNGQREQRGDIYTVRPDGTGLTLLTPPGPRYDDLCKGLAGDRVVFRRRFESSYSGGVTYGPREDLYTLPMGGGPEVRLAWAHGVVHTFHAFSPAGRLVYRGSADLLSADADGSQSVVLASGPHPKAFLGLAGGFVLYSEFITPNDVALLMVDGGGGAAVPLARSPRPKGVALTY